MLAVALHVLLESEKVPRRRRALYKRSRAAMDRGSNAAAESGDVAKTQHLLFLDMKVQHQMKDKQKLLEKKAKLDKLLETGATRIKDRDLHVIQSLSDSFN